MAANAGAAAALADACRTDSTRTAAAPADADVPTGPSATDLTISTLIEQDAADGDQRQYWLEQATPPPGWSAHWHRVQELVYYQMDEPEQGEWLQWIKYPKPGDKIPKGTAWYCHQCYWTLRDDKGDTECWYCKGWCGGPTADATASSAATRDGGGWPLAAADAPTRDGRGWPLTTADATAIRDGGGWPTADATSSAATRDAVADSSDWGWRMTGWPWPTAATGDGGGLPTTEAGGWPLPTAATRDGGGLPIAEATTGDGCCFSMLRGMRQLMNTMP